MNDRIKTIKDIFIIDKTRILRLLEIIQFATIGFVVGLLLYKIAEKIIVVYDEKMYDNNNLLLIKHLFYDIVILTLFVFYTNKLANIIPFIFDFIDRKQKKTNADGIVAFATLVVWIWNFSGFNDRVGLLAKKFDII